MVSENWNKTWELPTEYGEKYHGNQNNKWEVTRNLEIVIRLSEVTRTSGAKTIIKLKQFLKKIVILNSTKTYK